ncbi:MAG: UbiA family prenyltransferase [Erysipelothrix sp.]|nr:UbiA family prenyltransferase [Erysipelothrix sp.]
MNISNIHKYLRVNDWLDSKIPFMLASLIYFYLDNPNRGTFAEFTITFTSYLVYLFMFLSFSYVINDYSDIAVDKAAGKSKLIFNMSKNRIHQSLILLVILGCVPMFFIVSDKLTYIAISVLIYFFGAAYSIHRFRFKEKGILGLIECSTAQKCLPLLPILLIEQVSYLSFLIIIGISFINGLRYILIHQVLDFDNDLKTGVKTFVNSGGNHYNTAIKTALIFELILIFALLSDSVLVNPFFISVMILYAIFEIILAIVVVKYLNIDLLSSFTAVPLESFYNVFLPFILAVLLTFQDVRFAMVLLLMLLIVKRNLFGKFALFKIFFTSKEKYQGLNNQ